MPHSLAIHIPIMPICISIKSTTCYNYQRSVNLRRYVTLARFCMRQSVTKPPSYPEGCALRVSSSFRQSPLHHLFGLPPAFMDCMENQDCTAVADAPSDITFACSNCRSSLVVDGAAAGMTLDCQRCGKPTSVPKVATERAVVSAETQSKLADVQRQMKENESQRTEITSYINQHSIQLHRWQLRLQTLNERKKELEAALRGAA